MFSFSREARARAERSANPPVQRQEMRQRAFEVFRRIEYLELFAEFLAQGSLGCLPSPVSHSSGDHRIDVREDRRSQDSREDRRRDQRGGHQGSVSQLRGPPRDPRTPRDLPRDPYGPRGPPRHLSSPRDPMSPRRHHSSRHHSSHRREQEWEAQRRHEESLRRAQRESRHNYLNNYRRAVALAAQANARDQALANTDASASQDSQHQTIPMRLNVVRSPVVRSPVARSPRRRIRPSPRWRTRAAPTATVTAQTATSTAPVSPAVERPETYSLPGSPDSSRIDPHNPPVISLDLSVESMDQLVQEVRDLATSE